MAGPGAAMVGLGTGAYWVIGGVATGCAGATWPVITHFPFSHRQENPSWERAVRGERRLPRLATTAPSPRSPATAPAIDAGEPNARTPRSPLPGEGEGAGLCAPRTQLGEAAGEV